MNDIKIELKNDMLNNSNFKYKEVIYTAVKTTDIYCLPSCTAKKPKQENVEFFNTCVEAEAPK
ncbi:MULTISPECIES: Ada metal-binding domain-containing protein [Bacillus]|uniref:Ada metal-binding domain-containing protein n=1 Tax=Bacillus TaxID=1386 RepID=UPI0018E1EC7D|nr:MULTISPECIES: Ada metal-binding domain-containing protein [Bacillus]